MPYIANTPGETAEMLAALGMRSLDDLFADIPADMRPKSFDIPAGMDEMSALRRMEEMAARNRSDLVSFLGGGVYDHYIPAAVDALSSRAEFYTAYTPYQPEAAQGTLQAIFEYQTAVCRLFGMDCANASVYDGGGALVEAVLMAVRHTKRKRIVVDEAVNPRWRAMLATSAHSLSLDVVTVPHRDGCSDKEALAAALDGDCAAVATQNPNYFGVIDDYSALFAGASGKGALSILSANPVMQSLLKTPGEMGADIAVAEGQPLGLPPSFGGPYLGMMACRRDFVRQLPGRIVGRTTDRNGAVGYVLTLQAREQHIRRAKATSNICSNQALCALRTLVHMSLLGPGGLARAAGQSVENAHEAARRLGAVKGVMLLNNAPFANEFALRLPAKAGTVVESILKQGYAAGLPVGRHYAGMDDVLLVACTEKRTREQIARLAELLEGALA